MKDIDDIDLLEDSPIRSEIPYASVNSMLARACHLIPDNVFRLYVMLLTYAGLEHIFPKLETISAMRSRTVRVVRSQIEELEKLNLIERIPRYRQDGSRMSNEILIKDPARSTIAQEIDITKLNDGTKQPEGRLKITGYQDINSRATRSKTTDQEVSIDKVDIGSIINNNARAKEEQDLNTHELLDYFNEKCGTAHAKTKNNLRQIEAAAKVLQDELKCDTARATLLLQEVIDAKAWDVEHYSWTKPYLTKTFTAQNVLEVVGAFKNDKFVPPAEKKEEKTEPHNQAVYASLCETCHKAPKSSNSDEKAVECGDCAQKRNYCPCSKFRALPKGVYCGTCDDKIKSTISQIKQYGVRFVGNKGADEGLQIAIEQLKLLLGETAAMQIIDNIIDNKLG